MKKEFSFNLLRQVVLLFLLMFVGHGTRVYADEEDYVEGPFYTLFLTQDEGEDVISVDLNSNSGGYSIHLGGRKASDFDWVYDSDLQPITRIIVLTGSEWKYSNNRTYTEDGYTYHPVPIGWHGLNGDLNQGAGGDDIFLYYSKDHPENGYINKLYVASYKYWLTGARNKPSYYLDKDLNDGCGGSSNYVYVGAEYHRHTGVLHSWLDEDGYLCRGFRFCDKACQTKTSLKGIGWGSEPVQINSLDDYKSFARYFNSRYIPQTAYVNLNVDLMADFMSVEKIGSADYPFKGTLWGNGHYLWDNMKWYFLSSSLRVNGGLFGATQNATIQDLDIKEYSTYGRGTKNSYVQLPTEGYTLDSWGALTNIDEGSTFRNINFEDCGVTVQDGDYYGGIAGQAKNTTIENCQYLLGMGGSFGGLGLGLGLEVARALVGKAEGNLTIRNSSCLSGLPMQLVNTYTGDKANCKLVQSIASGNLIETGEATITNCIGNPTVEQMNNGELTYLANNGNTTNPLWRQRIGIDNVPTLKTYDNSIVYKHTGKNCKGVEYNAIYNNFTGVPAEFVFHQNVEFVKYYKRSTCLHPLPNGWIDMDETKSDYYWCHDCDKASLNNKDYVYTVDPTKVKDHRFNHQESMIVCYGNCYMEHWWCKDCLFSFTTDDVTTDENLTLDTSLPSHDLVRVDDTGKRTVTCLNQLPLHHFHCNTCGKNYGWGDDEGTIWDDGKEIELESQPHSFTTHQQLRYCTNRDPEYSSLTDDVHAKELESWYCESCEQWFTNSNTYTDEYIVKGEPVVTEKHRDCFISDVSFTTDPVHLRGCECGYDRHYVLDIAGKYSSRLLEDPESMPEHTYIMESFDIDESSKMKFRGEEYHLSAQTASYRGSIPANRKWGTVCLPFAFNTSLVVGVVFYQPVGIDIVDNNGELHLERVSGDVKAGTPLFVWRKSDDTSAALEYTISIDYGKADDATKISLSDPSETYGGRVIAYSTYVGYEVNCGSTEVNGHTYYGAEYGKDIFYLSGDQFWKATGTVDVKPYRVWLEVPGADSVKMCRLDAGVLDGIDNADANLDHSIYDLGGLRHSKTAEGVNIVDGKKVIVK